MSTRFTRSRARTATAEKPTEQASHTCHYTVHTFTHYGDGRLHPDFIGFGSDIPRMTHVQPEPEPEPEPTQEAPGKPRRRPSFGRR